MKSPYLFCTGIFICEVLPVMLFADYMKNKGGEHGRADLGIVARTRIVRLRDKAFIRWQNTARYAGSTEDEVSGIER